MKKYYLDGKCIFSYDPEVFASLVDSETIYELFIDPIREVVYERYYQKRLVQQVLEKVFKENMVVYWAYCDIKPLIENEELSVDYIQNDDETLLKCLMKEKLNSNEYGLFETLLNEAGDIAFSEEIKFLSNMNSMSEHFWVKR